MNKNTNLIYLDELAHSHNGNVIHRFNQIKKQMTTHKKTVIVDIDGTLTKVGDRLKFLNSSPKDWDSFYEACGEDEPVHNVIMIVNNLSRMYNIVLCTGRIESVREKTKKWLAMNAVYHHSLLMRKDNDYRHDTIIKPELLVEAGIGLEDIAFVLEDRNSVVKMFRELGLTVLQVAEGDF